MTMNRILIVDDIEENRYLLQALLQGHGYEVNEACNGADALQIARQNPPILIIADILMPVMDGFTLCREWKKDMRLKSIPFVFYTATYTDVRDREFALSLGAEQFIVKPEEPDAFMAMIRDTMQQAKKSSIVQFKPEEDVHDGMPIDVLQTEEPAYLKQYSEVLIRKLETKMAQLEQANCRLESDIAARRLAEAALGESEQRRAFAIEAARLGTFDWDLTTNRIAWNERQAELFGLTLDEFDGTTAMLEQFIPADAVKSIRQTVAQCQRSRSSYCQEFSVIWRDGSVHWISVSGNFKYSEVTDQAMHMYGVAADITDRKEAEAERERLMTAIEHAGEIILITDSKGIIAYVNPVFETVTGYTRQEAIGKTPAFLKSGEQNERFYRQLWETISGGRTWHGRFINKRKDGTLYTEETTISPICDATGQITNYVAVKRDITEQIRLIQQMQQAQKMESVGRLAGGVAHDINNILTVILGYTELAMEKMTLDDPLHDKLEEIYKGAGRSRDIIRQLLAFARKQTITPKVLDLNSTIESMLKMLRRLIGEDINLAWLPAAGLYPIKMDPGQIDQILANLCVNARDAIANTGKITIETGRVVFDQEYCSLHRGFIPGEFMFLAVSDNGSGMNKDTMKKIFEPFFSTKELGRGTGLGLATVYGIVKQNNGFINVYSEPGEGTIFRIYLPSHSGQEAENVKEMVETIPQSHGETVLVAEDDLSILQLVGTILNRLGHTVLTASTPAEAIRIAEESAVEIHLLITDVIMPAMNGSELAELIKSRRPGIKLLFMSGYTADTVANRGVLEEGIQFLSKPFSARDLAVKVRDVLDHK